MKNIFLTVLLSVSGINMVSAQDIIAVEYSIDEDNGYGNNTLVSLTPAQDDTFNFSISTSGLSRGYHILYFRTLDSDGKWSHTSYRTLEILDDVTPNLVEGVELFENTLGDFGTGDYIAFSNPQADGSFTLNFPYSQVQPGNVTMYFRVKDSKELRSFPAMKNFTIVKQNDPISVGEINNSVFSIYPNPANETITINFKEQPKDNATIVLTDMYGRIIREWKSDKLQYTLQLTQPAGTYFIKIISGEKAATEKVVIVN